MSNDTIDRKIVEMEFKNSRFEENVGQSINSIDKLKRSLNFENLGSAFSSITQAAGKVNLSTMSESLTNISNKFTTMGIIAITTLTNIVNSAVNAGIRLGKALTIDPIKAGLEEYEVKLNSIQTILANTEKEGTTLEIVTEALDTLNEYSDKTIYNFQQMTRNVGTFTAAGVKLSTSVQAIKGIANLAAISGSNAEQASTAMYQLSQALASGTVKLMDWNSVVNAGMGGQVFQEAIKETARLHGVAIDDMIKQDGSFRETLQRGWFTSEILTETLAKFTGDLNADQLRTMGYTEEQIESILQLGKTATDAATKVKTFSQLFSTLKEAAQSGWAKTWEIIIGDFEEARTFFTEANNILGGMIGSSADIRNQIAQGWKDLGGRTVLIDSVRIAFQNILDIIKPIRDAFTEIFPPITAQQIYNLTVGLKELLLKFKIGAQDAERLKRIFKGVFAIFDILGMVVGSLAKNLFKLSGGAISIVDSFLDILAVIADYIVNIRNSWKETDFFNKLLERIGNNLKPLVSFFLGFINLLKKMGQSLKTINFDGFSSIGDKLSFNFQPITKITSILGKTFSLLGKILEKFAPIFFKLSGMVTDGLSNFLDTLLISIENFDLQKALNLINTGLFGALLLALRNFVGKGGSLFDAVIRMFTNFGGSDGIFGKVSGILDQVRSSLEAWQLNLKSNVLLKIAGALGILAVSIFILSSIDSTKMTIALTAMTTMFIQLGFALSAFQKISSTMNPVQMTTLGSGLLLLSGSILLLSVSISKLGKMETKDLIKGLLAITAIIELMKYSAKSLEGSSASIITGSIGLIVFGLAIKTLTSSIDKLGSMDNDKLSKGLIGVGVLIGQIALFLKLTDLSGLGLINSVGILILAGSLMILSGVVEKLGNLSIDAITKGLSTLAIIFAELAIFSNITGSGTSLILTSAGMLIISASMLILAEVLERIGNLSWESLGKGLTTLATALVLIGAASYLISPTLIIQAAGLVVMAGALIILADALEKMGNNSWEEIGRGLALLAGSLTILTIALYAMSGSLAGSFALLVAAGALLVIAPALNMLGKMSLEEIGKSLLVLAGVFTVLGLAAYILTPVIPSLLGLGAALFLIGAGSLAFGAGILALSIGLTALAAAGTAGTAALVLAITGIVGLIPAIIKALGLGLLAIVDVLVEGAPKLLEGIVTLLNILLDGLIIVIPKLGDTITLLILELLDIIKQSVPELIETGYTILLAFLQGISDNIGPISSISASIITKFLNSLAENLPSVIQAGWNLLISFIDGMTASVEENLPLLIESGNKLAISIIEGIVNGLLNARNDSIQAIIDIGNDIIKSFKEVLGINSPSSVFINIVGNIIDGIVIGITNGKNNVITAMTTLVNNLTESIRNRYNEMVTAGFDLVSGLSEGIRNHIESAVGAARELATTVLNTISNVFDSNSPSKELFKEGKNIDDGLTMGIEKFSYKVISSGEKLGDSTLNSVSKAISKIPDLLNADLDFNPAIKPVLDLSNIQNGSKSINSMFSGIGLNLTPNINKISSIQLPSQEQNSINPDSETTSDKKIINFTQNNYSPKELSRLDIYRDTRNQLLSGKGFID